MKKIEAFLLGLALCVVPVFLSLGVTARAENLLPFDFQLQGDAAAPDAPDTGDSAGQTAPSGRADAPVAEVFPAVEATPRPERTQSAAPTPRPARERGAESAPGSARSDSPAQGGATAQTPETPATAPETPAAAPETSADEPTYGARPLGSAWVLACAMLLCALGITGILLLRGRKKR